MFKSVVFNNYLDSYIIFYFSVNNAFSDSYYEYSEIIKYYLLFYFSMHYNYKQNSLNFSSGMNYIQKIE